jgi:hypothetical protein
VDVEFGGGPNGHGKRLRVDERGAEGDPNGEPPGWQVLSYLADRDTK